MFGFQPRKGGCISILIDVVGPRGTAMLVDVDVPPTRIRRYLYFQ